jgi:methylthioribose-1-phosphate isomerase
MAMPGLLLRGFLALVMAYAISSAIISAAPAIGVILAVGFLLWLYDGPDPPDEDDKKPP